MSSDARGPRARKAVIPAAGLATRFLPATKAVPKELLPVVDRPVLQYIVEEAAARRHHATCCWSPGGARRRWWTTSTAGPTSRRGWRRRATSSGSPRSAAPASWPRSTPAARASRSGSGTRSSYAESHVGGEPFAVLLGDEFVDVDAPLLPAMLDLQARTGGIVLAFIEVDPAETTRYGIASVAPSDSTTSDVVRGDRPGREAVAGRGAEQPRRRRPLRAAHRRSSTRSAGPSRAAAARSS